MRLLLLLLAPLTAFAASYNDTADGLRRQAMALFDRIKSADAELKGAKDEAGRAIARSKAQAIAGEALVLRDKLVSANLVLTKDIERSKIGPNGQTSADYASMLGTCNDVLRRIGDESPQGKAFRQGQINPLNGEVLTIVSTIDECKRLAAEFERIAAASGGKAPSSKPSRTGRR